MITFKQKIKKVSFALLVVLMSVGCAATSGISETPYINLSNINLLTMGVFEQRYRIMMRIQNPNDVSIPIKGMSYHVFINGKEFAHGVNNKPVVIPEFGEKVIEIEATSDLTSILRQFQELMSGGIEKVSYRLEGKAKLSNRIRRLSYKYKGELNLQPDSKDGHGFFLSEPNSSKRYSPTITN
ncbi:MAG: hypothetical protein D8M57_04985 [Candidatus Scalindua sp. AMX11]|nr:MAG: hypothetical protein DWQ00_07800 [Candidatus Scalindua sp.]RZV91344.1 MAG: hypothetical protein EX341_05270 [Candidatus Scalindua sp. SCAELEC01]TDE65901.1 MAG: hypothetical protein D8M57_04985 [Candidatus Scalindua sp. AMX11]GJQ60745.1 MAG: hypothetical protein SCALA701_35460 [Candidatus Scalindua sp.]